MMSHNGIDYVESNGVERILVDKGQATAVVLEDGTVIKAQTAEGIVGSIAHMAYHLGAIRQIDKAARGPREGTFA